MSSRRTKSSRTPNNNSSSRRTRNVPDEDDDTLNAQPLQAPTRNVTSSSKQQTPPVSSVGGVAMIRPPNFSSITHRTSVTSSEGAVATATHPPPLQNQTSATAYMNDIAKIATTASLISDSTSDEYNNQIGNNNNNNTTTLPPSSRRPPPFPTTPANNNLNSNASQTTASTVMPPPLPPIGRQQSTPGAVAVTGVFTNLRTQEYNPDDYTEDWETLASRNSLPTMIGVPREEQAPPLTQPESTRQVSQTLTLLRDNDEEPVVAELAPDEGDVAARVAERISAEMTLRLKREVQEQLQQQSAVGNTPIVAAERMPEITEDAREQSSTPKSRQSQDKICGVRRSCWGIWMLFFMFAAGGAGAGVILYQKGIFGGDDGGGDRPPNETRETPSPTQAPTGNANKRREALILQILSPYILPRSSDDLANPSSPQAMALKWMVESDTYTNLENVIDDDDTVDDVTARQVLERYTLAVFYNANGIALNNNLPQEPKTNWNLRIPKFATSNHCDWNTDTKLLITESHNEGKVTRQGVFCNDSDDEQDEELEDGSIGQLQFANFGLQGELPWELSLLTNLVELDMDDNFLFGTLPLEFFRDWTRLVTLWLRKNDFSGPLPVALRRLSNLESLDLNENNMAGTLPSEWGSRLSNLRYLGLGLNQVQGSLPADWSLLTNLQFWDMEGNRLTGSIPTEYGSLERLETLFLETNGNLDGQLPSELGNLDNLKQFFVFNNRLTGTIPSEYGDLTNLEYFWFHGNMLEGSVDSIFCHVTTTADWNLIGDCLGDPPAIECSCCVSCCSGTIANQTCMEV